MPIRRVPDLDSLELLLQIDSTGSLAQAGQRYGLSQPAVTARLRTMERLMGTQLVERSARGSRLTAAGNLVADWARTVLDSALALEAGIDAGRWGAERSMVVAASLTVAEHLLPRWLVQLGRLRPDVLLRLNASGSTHVVASVTEGESEIGFVEGPRRPEGLLSRVVAEDELTLVVGPSHPWARRRPRRIDVEELSQTRLVSRENTSGTRQSVEQALRTQRPLAPPVAEFSTTRAIIEAVETGWAPAVLSDLAVAGDLALGRLVRIEVDRVDLRRQLRGVWRREVELSDAAAQLLAIAAHHRRQQLRSRTS